MVNYYCKGYISNYYTIPTITVYYSPIYDYILIFHHYLCSILVMTDLGITLGNNIQISMKWICI